MQNFDSQKRGWEGSNIHDAKRQLLKAFSWKKIDSLNPYMVSYVKEETNIRLNYYFTTNTLTVDTKKEPCHVHRNVTSANLEEILLKYEKTRS